MPTILGTAFVPEYSGVPPGMSKLDNLLWQKFQKEHSQEWLRVFYNCRLGDIGYLPDEIEPAEKQMWEMLTLPRVDAIIETKKDVLITEIRPNAARNAFGACLLYRQLYEQDQVFKKPHRSVIVTDFMTIQMKTAYKEALINVFIVTPDNSPGSK